MLPTLPGRIQTRIFSLVIIGSIVQLIFSGILPGMKLPIGEMYKITFGVLLATIVLGVVWEFVYQGLMQFRWEKDWPTLFGLLTVINEGAVVWFVIKTGVVPGVPKELPFSTFVTDFLLVWMITFFWLNGPMRVPFISWRHEGGRLV